MWFVLVIITMFLFFSLSKLVPPWIIDQTGMEGMPFFIMILSFLPSHLLGSLWLGGMGLMSLLLFVSIFVTEVILITALNWGRQYNVFGYTPVDCDNGTKPSLLEVFGLVCLRVLNKNFLFIPGLIINLTIGLESTDKMLGIKFVKVEKRKDS